MSSLIVELVVLGGGVCFLEQGLVDNVLSSTFCYKKVVNLMHYRNESPVCVLLTFNFILYKL